MTFVYLHISHSRPCHSPTHSQVYWLTPSWQIAWLEHGDEEQSSKSEQNQSKCVIIRNASNRGPFFDYIRQIRHANATNFWFHNALIDLFALTYLFHIAITVLFKLKSTYSDLFRNTLLDLFVLTDLFDNVLIDLFVLTDLFDNALTDLHVCALTDLFDNALTDLHVRALTDLFDNALIDLFELTDLFHSWLLCTQAGRYTCTGWPRPDIDLRVDMATTNIH